jgi:hypothetical protein
LLLAVAVLVVEKIKTAKVAVAELAVLAGICLVVAV